MACLTMRIAALTPTVTESRDGVRQPGRQGVVMAMTPGSVSFGVLGPLQVSTAGTPLSLGGPKQRVVVATLLMNRNRPVAVDILITAAWEDHPPPPKPEPTSTSTCPTCGDSSAPSTPRHAPHWTNTPRDTS
jgi:hypothetical protein